MMMYLLLRDNKQSGPYSADDLKEKGLKAYDLVWVEGRSAAWRYPSEIDELSSFAPAVEEQPFDRFFKKPVVASSAEAVQAITASATLVQAIAQPDAKAANSAKRSIYVTMPGGMAARDESVRKREVVREIIPVREIAPVREAAPLRERVSYPPEPAIEILPALPRRKPAKIWGPVAIGCGVLTLLAAGIFIGLSIQKDRSGSAGSLKLASKEQPVARTVAQQLPVSPANSTTTAPADAIAKGPAAPLVAQSNLNGTPAEGSAGKTRVKTPRQKTELLHTPVGVPALAADSTAAQAADPRREAMHRTDVLQTTPIANHESLRLTLANQVSVGANKYDVGTFGGIHNLQVTVANRSGYSLDLVVVAVSYIQANKKTYKTENLYFRGIAPGTTLMLEAPKSSRGVSVEYKITSINSKELGISEPGT